MDGVYHRISHSSYYFCRNLLLTSKYEQLRVELGPIHHKEYQLVSGIIFSLYAVCHAVIVIFIKQHWLHKFTEITKTN